MATEQFTWAQWDYFLGDLGLITLLKNSGKTAVTITDAHVTTEADMDEVVFTINGSKVITLTWAAKNKIEEMSQIIRSMRDSGGESGSWEDTDKNMSFEFNTQGVSVTIGA